MKKLAKLLILAVVLVLIVGTVFSSAVEPYDTYTYSIDGEPLKSPAAFSAIDDFDAVDMKISAIDPQNPVFSNKGRPTDIVADHEGRIYISDTYNNRIVILNKYYEAIHIISTYRNKIGQTKALSTPKGIFVTDPNLMTDGSSYIYVCNRGVNDIGEEVGEVVIFDRETFEYVDTIDKPESQILEADAFQPDAIAVDKYGRIFITSMSAYEGVIVLSSDGAFTGFIGAQEVTVDILDLIWRKFFMSQEQLESQALELATPYNNITVDADGFVYVTTNATEAEDLKNQFSAIKSKKATFSPIKKLNAQGKEILNRNGFFDPGGEVVINSKDVSTIVDVAIGAGDTWTILDQKRSRFFTYDQSGNLLFAFGGTGDQLGQGSNLIGITYQVIEDSKTGKEVHRLLSFSQSGIITVYEPTEYYYSIIDALESESKNDYVQSRLSWDTVRSQNNNFDLAYIGIGKALYHQGKYDEAMDYLESAYETDVWSKASGAAGKDFMTVWLFPVLILIIAVIVLFFKFLGYAKRVNKETALVVGRKSYWQEMLYAFHLVFHPFDGFWDLKHEKRGSVRAATTILAITGVALFYQSIGKGYPFNPRGESMNILLLFGILIAVFFLFIVANWCLTTLFEGEGSFKDIYIATAYSLAPAPLFLIISTILTNVLTIEAQSIVSLISSIGWIWVGILIFFGTLVTHDYPMKKNFVTILGTLLAMLVIAFLIALFFSLVAKMIGFVTAIFTEVGNRM